MTDTGLAPLPEGYYWRIKDEGEFFTDYVLRLMRVRKHWKDAEEWKIALRIPSVSEFREHMAKTAEGNELYWERTGQATPTYEAYLRTISEYLKAKWMARDIPVGMARYVGNYPPKSLKEV